MNSRKRVIIGISLLAVTFLFTLHEGVVGELLARALGYLFGQTGTGVLAVTMFVSGAVLVLPRDAIGRFVRWSWRGREARVDRVVRESRRAAREASAPHPIEVEHVEAYELAPRDRRNLDAVRDALKSLQYKKHEYEPLVSAMDPNVPFEALVKGALKKLNEKRN